MQVGIIRKIIGCALAILLVLGIVPVGLLYFTTPVVAEGRVVKISPGAETFVYSDAKNKNKSRLDEDNLLVGNYWNTYFRFDLSAIGNAKKSDISQAKLRLAVIWDGRNEPDETDCSFNVSYLDNNNWGDNMTWSTKPGGEEQYLCTAAGNGSDSILEIDLSEFIRKAVGNDEKVFTLKLSPSVSNTAPVQIASTRYSDPSYRPYLKILVGDAVDTDTKTLNKSYLDTNGYVSKAEPNTNSNELLYKNNGRLAVDNGSAVYLKFNIEPKNILGAVEDARIFLRPIGKSVNTKIDIYYLENDGWNSGELSYNNRPEGELSLIKSYNGLEVSGGFSVDVTDLVYKLVKSGKYTASFLIDGTQTDPASTDSLELYSSYSHEFAPSLSVSVTDDKNMTAIREAIMELKGNNSSFDNVTSDLPSSYIAENGERVTIKWDFNDNYSLGNILGFRKSVITTSGQINPPAFFEDAKTIQAKAILSSGSRTLERFVTMTIQTEFGVPIRMQILKDAVLGD